MRRVGHDARTFGIVSSDFEIVKSISNACFELKITSKAPRVPEHTKQLEHQHKTEALDRPSEEKIKSGTTPKRSGINSPWRGSQRCRISRRHAGRSGRRRILYRTTPSRQNPASSRQFLILKGKIRRFRRGAIRTSPTTTTTSITHLTFKSRR